MSDRVRILGFRPTGPACPLAHPNWESPTGQVGECESKEAGKEVLAAKGTLVDLSEDGMIAQEQREKQARARVWTNLDEALKQRRHVYRLDLSRQRLTRVPAEIGKLNKVETCSLADNELTEASLPALDEEARPRPRTLVLLDADDIMTCAREHVDHVRAFANTTLVTAPGFHCTWLLSDGLKAATKDFC